MDCAGINLLGTGATEDYTNDSLDSQRHFRSCFAQRSGGLACRDNHLDQRLFDSDEDLESTDSEGPKRSLHPFGWAVQRVFTSTDGEFARQRKSVGLHSSQHAFSASAGRQEDF